MWRTLRYSAILFALSLLMGCNSLMVRGPELNLPPLPPEVMLPCQEPEPLPDGQLSTLYLQMLRDTGPWGECRRRQAQLVALVKYQQQVRDEYARSLPQQNKPWWKF
jgi:hypothetical protein